MNDPQVWTLIGVFAAVMLGGMTLMTTMMNRVVRAEIGGLRAAMNARFDTVDHKVETLDKEVATLATRFWGSP